MMQKLPSLFRYWIGGIRLYIALVSVLLTFAVWWWAHTLYGGTALETIRIGEVYGWLSVTFLALALFVAPVAKLFAGMPGKHILYDSRRALGLSAAWFATLHMGLIYFKQFEAINPLKLPTSYQQAMLLGLIALLILLAMAATSVNSLMKKMGVWWFRLHRLVYIAVTLILIHAFMIGTHAITTTALIALSVVAVFWIIMNIAVLIRSHEIKTSQVLSLSLCILVLAGVLTFGLNQHYEKARAAAEAHGHQ